MAYLNRILSTGTVFGIDGNGVWSFADLDGDGNQDLVFIKTRNTGSGKIEVHGSYKVSGFQHYNVATGTAFAIEDNGTWLMQDWTGDGRADLVYIKTRNTGAGTVELHIADAASGYQNFVLHTSTCFGCEDNGVWTMTRNGDLVYIKTRNCGSNKIELHVASKASNYQQFTLHVTTDFDVEDNGTWCLSPQWDGDFAGLYYIKTRNTAGMVEIHAVSASSGYKTRIIAVATCFAPEDNGKWLMVDYTRRPRPDLAYIKTTSTGAGKIEVHIAESGEQDKSFLSGKLLSVRSASILNLYDWETELTVRRIDCEAQNVFWSETGDLMTIACKESFYVLRYNRQAYSQFVEAGGSVIEEGVEEALEFVTGIPETVRRDDGSATTSSTPIRPTDSTICYAISLSVIEYQTAVLRGDMDTAAALLPPVPQDQHNKIARLLEGEGYKDLALAVSTDEDHQFELAIQLSCAVPRVLKLWKESLEAGDKTKTSEALAVLLTMEHTQSFRLAGTTQIHNIPIQHMDGQSVVYWENIEQAFPSAKQVKNGNVAIPRCIKSFPGVVLDVVLSSVTVHLDVDSLVGDLRVVPTVSLAATRTVDFTDTPSGLLTTPSSKENFVEDLRVASVSAETPLGDIQFHTLSTGSSILPPTSHSKVKATSETALSFKEVVQLASKRAKDSDSEAQMKKLYGDVAQIITLHKVSDAKQEEIIRLQKQALEGQEKMDRLQDHVLHHQKEIQQLQIENQEELRQMHKEAMGQLAVLQSRVQAVLTQTFELHEYPIPRLFIVLPQDPAGWDA
ncbi:hypothetical protein BGZ98_002421, partial [Dissophora globulifera]